MRVLVTGAGGQLGRDVVDAFDGHELVACTRAELDLSDRDSVMQAICSTEPDAVVHAGAYTAVDAAESDCDGAFRVNALGTRWVAQAARIVGAQVCYLSTDYVFDGTSPDPYDEWAATNPQSVYGRSKLGGEHELDPGSIIVRTSWVCGAHGANFVRTMLRLAAERDELRVVADQRGCPTFTADLAGAIRRLVVARQSGTFHVTNQGPTTWFDFAREILRLGGFSPEKIGPTTTADYGAPAPRPANSVLDNAALRLAGLPLLPPWQESLERLVKEIAG
ncbi:MAG TPA: dTDP-4-dehydrorhamnose reductase [Acidimicrobiales bacterium]|nr:dTDP-4-dehydrorhamnose reductase [Acidimicrobiales bacterium]